ncbi:MAG: hypothetical protein ABIN58_09985, partial [candidate division WOR-3 bacterium]
MKARCPSCNCLLEIVKGSGEIICPGCGEVLAFAATGKSLIIRTLGGDEDPYYSVAREWEKAIEEGDYERAERLRREMERMMGETSEEEELEVVEDEEEGLEELTIKRGYDEDEEDFGEQEWEDEDFEEEENGEWED